MLNNEACMSEAGRRGCLQSTVLPGNWLTAQLKGMCACNQVQRLSTPRCPCVPAGMRTGCSCCAAVPLPLMGLNMLDA